MKSTGLSQPAPVALTGTPTRVLLADPEVLVLEGLRALLPPGCHVVGCVRDGLSLVSDARRLQPHLVVSEGHLPGLDAVAAARQLRDACPQARIVFLTSVEDEGLAARAFAAGVQGYLLKSATAAEFAAGLRKVMRGSLVLTPRISGGRPEALTSASHAPTDGSGLSPRAAEVVRLLALGNSMKEAAWELGITPRTVAYHKYGAMQTLGLRTSADLVRFAVDAGIVPPASQGRVA